MFIENTCEPLVLIVCVVRNAFHRDRERRKKKNMHATACHSHFFFIFPLLEESIIVLSNVNIEQAMKKKVTCKTFQEEKDHICTYYLFVIIPSITATFVASIHSVIFCYTV